ncbi:MAG: putative addiction module antidote protein [Phenylobacterium sp.]|jgi:probable addiction module antidote protein
MMEISAYDPAVFLKTDEDIAQYLNDAYEDSDPQVFIIALGDVAKIQGVAKVAKQANLNRESLYKVFSGKSQPQWSTIQKVMKALNVHINPVCHVHA